MWVVRQAFVTHYRFTDSRCDENEGLQPETPAVVEQEEYETRTGLAFQVGRLAQALTGLQHGAFTLRLADPEPGSDAPDAP